VIINKRKTIIILFFGLYFLVWFVCALIYRNEANKTNGDAFSFNSDIIKDLKYRAFLDCLKFPKTTQPINSLSQETIKALNNTSFENIPFIKEMFEEDRRAYRGFLAYRKIFGLKIDEFKNRIIPKYEIWDKYSKKMWGDFYYYMFHELGVTHFRNKSLDPDNLFERDFLHNRNAQYEILYLYKVKNINELKSTENVYKYEQNENNYELLYEILIKFVDDYSYNEQGFQKKKYGLISRFTSYEFSAFFDSAVWLPDDSIVYFHNVLDGEYKYPLIDFLYFSTVTITTLGYGDILPNSSFVRMVVMVETCLGMFLLGGIITIVFSSSRKKGNIS